jgi:hypothetical protein
MLSKRLYVAIGVLSASIIAYQLALMQNLSYVQWSHFAYMVISVALLGFGASGTILSLFRSYFVKRYTTILPLLFALCAVFMAMVMFLTQKIIPGFNPFMVFGSTREVGALVLVYLTYFLPFLFGGAAIGLVYTKHSSSIGGLYFADLTGAAAGGVLLTSLLWIFSPWQLTSLLSLLPLAGAFLVLDYKKSRKTLPFLAVCALLSGHFIIRNDTPSISEYKSLSKTLTMQGSKVILERSSPYGQLHAVSSPIMRFAPGLSLCANQQPPHAVMLFTNGNWFGAILQDSTVKRNQFYDYTLYALPFAAGSPSKLLMLDAGTAPYASYCLHKGARSATLVEQNLIAVNVLQGTLAGIHDSLLYNPKVMVVKNSSRSVLLSDTSRYNLIVFPDVGSIDGQSGMMAASEQYLLTIEAFKEAWNRLSSNGYLIVAAWLDYPPRVPLRLLSTIKEMLNQQDITNPEKHIVLARSWSNAVFLVKKSPFTSSEIDRIHQFCTSQCFDPVFPTSIRPDKESSFNVLQDQSLENFCDSILYGDAQHFQAHYGFDIRPTTDSKPYFYRFFKPSRYQELKERYTLTSLARMEPGYFFIFITFAQILAAAIILIILPLLFLKIKGKGGGFTLLYFSGLGIGFMFVEIVLIQQLILFFGQPIYAAAVVISLLLLFSGIGSFSTEKHAADKTKMQKVLLTIIPIILLYALTLGYILGEAAYLSIVGKVALGILLIGPPAFVMGMAFPLGIKLLSQQNQTLVPWAWGINSCTSVVSTVLATIISLHAGFRVVMIIAAGAYLISLLTVTFRKE